jgi:arginine repressor
MPRPKKEIPTKGIKGLKTLLKEGKTQREIVAYYKSKGFDVGLGTVNRRIKELKESEEKNG